MVILQALKRAPGFQNTNKADDADILLARAMYKTGDKDGAIELLNQRIIKKPENAVAKVALAEIYVLEKRADEADPLLKESLLLDMPEQFRAKLKNYLYARERTKPLKFNFGFAVVPDTNVNAATNNSEVEIFGLPFTLSEDAQASSGVGLQVNAGVNYRISKIGQNAFVSTSLNGDYTAYSNNSEFNNGALSGQVGVSYAPSKKTALRFNIKGFYTNFGGETFNYGYGPEAIAQFVLNKKKLLRISLSGLRVENEQDQNRDAYHISARTLLRHKLSNNSAIEGYVAVERESARSRSLSNTIYRIGTGYEKKFDSEISIYINPEGYIRPFDEKLAIFPERRKDKHISLSVAVSKQDWKIWNTVPVLRVVYDRNYSNLPLFDYKRTQFFIQFNKSF